MSQEENKEFEMAVGTSSILESNIMDGGENFYTPMESATEPEPAAETNWNVLKNDTGQLCRSCANSSDYLIPIYEGEGLEHQLEYKIQKHLPIQVSSTDTLPLQLCYQCASTLIAWDSMINSCIEADKKLRAMQEAAEEVKQNQSTEDSQADADNEANAEPEVADSDDEPLIASKSKLLSEKNVVDKEATPLKKKILSKTKSKSVTAKTEKTVQVSKEGDDKERFLTAEIRFVKGDSLSDKPEDKDGEDGALTYGETQVNLIRANIFKKQTLNTPFKRWVKCNHCLTMFSTKASLTRHLKRSSCKEESRDIDSLSYLSLNEIKEAIYGSKSRKKSETSSEVPPLPNIMTVSDKMDNVKNSEGSERSETFQNKAELDNNLSTHQRQLHLCPVCGKQFSYRSSLVSHQMIHQKLPKCHRCSLCSAAFTTIRSLRRHQYTHCDNRDKEFICEYCGKRFAYALTLKNHKLSHSEERPHSCRICETSFKRISHLRAHEQGVHNLSDRCQPKNYTCGVCQKSMVKKESLEAHMKEHTGELNYKCNDCHKKFATNTGLNIHISMARCEHYIKSCNVCQLEFKADEPTCEHLKTKSVSKRPRKAKDEELRSIVKTNTPGKKYKVPRHLKERNYFCKICGKDYIYPCELKTHFRLAHTDEKPFVCGQCGKAFKAKASLQMHEDVHNDHRPHQCNICQKRFRKTEHLKLHVRTHTGEKPHVCEVCGRGFTQKGDMKKHLQKTHKRPAPQQQQEFIPPNI